jgi:hypothetical protein
LENLWLNSFLHLCAKFKIITMLKSTKITLVFLIITLTLSAQTITNYPYTESFTNLVPATGQQIPTGWSAENLNNDPAIWDVLPNSASYPGNAHTAPNAIHMSFNPSVDANDWLFTPPLQMQAGGVYTLSFWYKAVDTGFGTVEKMKIHAGTMPTNVNMEADPIWGNGEIINEDYVLDSVQYYPSASGVYYFGFHAYSEPFQFLLAMDDVTITQSGVSANQEITQMADYQAFPNPCSSVLNIMATKSGLVTMFDFSGKKVLSKSMNVGKNTLNVADLSAGLYGYQIWNGTEMSVGKVVINR